MGPEPDQVGFADFFRAGRAEITDAYNHSKKLGSSFQNYMRVRQLTMVKAKEKEEAPLYPKWPGQGAEFNRLSAELRGEMKKMGCA